MSLRAFAQALPGSKHFSTHLVHFLLSRGLPQWSLKPLILVPPPPECWDAGSTHEAFGGYLDHLQAWEMGNNFLVKSSVSPELACESEE